MLCKKKALSGVIECRRECQYGMHILCDSSTAATGHIIIIVRCIAFSRKGAVCSSRHNNIIIYVTGCIFLAVYAHRSLPEINEKKIMTVADVEEIVWCIIIRYSHRLDFGAADRL